MRLAIFKIILLIATTCLVLPPSALAFKIKEDRIKEVISRIMKGNELPGTEAERGEALKEFDLFLTQFDIRDREGADNLTRLGHLMMSMEENEEEHSQVKGAPSSRQVKPHTFSIRIYEKIRASSLANSQSDEVLYQLAHGYDDQNQKEKSLSLLQELVTRYPKSIHYAEARFRIGESFFDEGKYPEASESYLKALDSNSAQPLLDFISYKLIWSYFRMGEYRKSVDMIMNELNRYGTPQRNGTILLDIESFSDATWKQVKELIHLAVLSFDFWGGSQKAKSYFDYHGHLAFENLIYRPLGLLYMSRGKYQEAAQTFSLFLSLYPTHEDAPLFQVNLIESYQKAEKWDLARAGKSALIENFKPGSAWWNANGKIARDKASLIRKEILYQLAQDFHGEAQKSKKREDYLAAITGYQNFLSNFPREMEAPRIQYFLAEAYFETGQFEQAASAYETSAYQYPLHQYSQEAAYAALISFEKSLQSNPNASALLKTALIKSCRTFLKTFPDSPKKEVVLFKVMSLSLQAGDLQSGRADAKQILNTPLDKATVEMIGQTHYLLARSYFDERDYSAAESEFKETLAWRRRADYPPAEGPSDKELVAFLASISYKRADALKNKLLWKEAGKAFYHVYEELPESELAPVSLMNSGGAYLEAKDYESALNSFLQITSHYPRSGYYTEAETTVTSIYEKENKWNEAAAGYETLMTLAPDQEKKTAYQDKLYSLYYRGENWTKLNQLLEPRFRDHSLTNPKWVYYYAAAAKELKKEPEIITAADYNLSLLKKTSDVSPASAEWIMRSLLLKGDLLYRQFVSTPLASPLEMSLPRKKDKLKEAMDAYTMAAQSDNPDIATESFYHIGNLFEQFASDLIRSERPKDLTPEQSEIYESLLKTQIDPLYQKAIEVYQKNLTFSNRIENDWIRRSEARYRQLILEKKGVSS